MQKRNYIIKIYDFQNKSCKKDIMVFKTNSNLEIVIEEYYKLKGFNVLNLDPRRYTILPNLVENVPQKSGLPDLCVSFENSCFFVEVKSINDTLTYNQIDWIFNCKFDCFVAYVYEEYNYPEIKPVEVGKMSVQYGEFKGNKLIKLIRDEDDQYPFQFGVEKARLIVENIDAIKKFVEESNEEVDLQ